MPISRSSTLIDVCFTVCAALDRIGTIAVLTGGSAATFYAPRAYQSRDADFIIVLHTPKPGSIDVMSALGYTLANGTYVHNGNPFTVEFPRGPLAIGDDLISKWDTVTRANKRLHILSRTDCVRDRLAWFYHGADRSALQTAVDVAASGDIDMELISDWSVREGATQKFRQFQAQLCGK